MHLEFYGAAGEVTGSLHRLHVNGVDVLLDCGLFQGHRVEANRLNREVPKWATGAHCLVLSHAHLDHSGKTSPSNQSRSVARYRSRRSRGPWNSSHGHDGHGA